MRLPAYPVYRVMADCRYRGLWFRVDGADLYVTGATDRMTDALRHRITDHKPDIIAAVNQLPPTCSYPTVCLNAGLCGQCQTHHESECAA